MASSAESIRPAGETEQHEQKSFSTLQISLTSSASEHHRPEGLKSCCRTEGPEPAGVEKNEHRERASYLQWDGEAETWLPVWSHQSSEACRDPSCQQNCEDLMADTLVQLRERCWTMSWLEGDGEVIYSHNAKS